MCGDATMSTRASDVLRRWFQEVWCDGRPETIHELFAADGVAHGVGREPVRGPGGFLEFWNGFRSTFSSIHIAVQAHVDEGPLAYVRCVASMTFRGRPVTLEGGCLARVRHGQIVECWNQWDFAGLMIRMGALPEDCLPRAFAGDTLAFQGRE
jgi:hypothetical protein